MKDLSNKKLDPFYTCPACGHGFTAKQKKGKACPSCQVELKAVQKHEGNKFYYVYELAEAVTTLPPVSSNGVKNSGVPELPYSDGELVSQQGIIPEEYLLNLKENLWRVVYRNVVWTGWVYCPKCGRAMFQNRTVNSTFAQEHKCRHNDCKAIVETVFLGDQTMRIS